MEFTKIEKRILNDKTRKSHKVCLWLGILCLILAVGSLFFIDERAKKAQAPFLDMYASLEKEISPETTLEIKLKKSLLEATKVAGDAWYKYVAEMGENLFSYFLFIGVFLISDYFVVRIYLNLIRKLKDFAPK